MSAINLRSDVLLVQILWTVNIWRDASSDQLLACAFTVPIDYLIVADVLSVMDSDKMYL